MIMKNYVKRLSDILEEKSINHWLNEFIYFEISPLKEGATI